MVLSGATLFLSAFLLFLVQPLLGKSLLPWFGGSPAVWTSCMLFFQLFLLCGYGYAHVLAVRVALRRQAIIHLLLLVASLAALPVLPSPRWRPSANSRPALLIPGLLTVCVGFPYVMLAATAPLLQAWHARSRGGESPYRLFSISNSGSLLAILSYPFLIEPVFSLQVQGKYWSWCYCAFVAACALCAVLFDRSMAAGARTYTESAVEPAAGRERPGALHQALWILLPACSSLVLLSTTNQLCQEVAAIPLLWVLPLGLYLLSFVLCFGSPRLYTRAGFGILLVAALALSCQMLFEGVFAGLRNQIAAISLTLIAACMICHGELARIRPDPRHLTRYYGMIAAGGAFGGVLVALVAPLIFRGYWEYHVGLIATPLLLMVALIGDGSLSPGRRVVAASLLGAAVLILSLALEEHLRLVTRGNLEMSRSFYGVLRVFEEDRGDPRFHRVTLMHGRIQHGFQYQAPFRRNWPTSYFSPLSGVGLALRYHPDRTEGVPNFRIGVVGLGTGTLAAYCRPGDYIRFYEINPDVIRIARKFFSFIRDCPAQLEIVQGDARISMERETGMGEHQPFDVLAVDAFNGDAIPMHLLTRECMEVYRSHLKPDGILALHISSRYFDLAPVARSFEGPNGVRAVLVSNIANRNLGVEASDWVLLTSNDRFLSAPGVRAAVQAWKEQTPRTRPWTDDRSSLFQSLRR